MISIVYADLCEKDEELIQHLEESGEKYYYISRMVSNQILSYNSPYRRQNRFSGLSSDLEPYLNTFPDEVPSKTLKTLEKRLTGEDLIILDMVVNDEWNKGYRVRPMNELMERYHITKHYATKTFDQWRKKVKQLLK